MSDPPSISTPAVLDKQKVVIVKEETLLAALNLTQCEIRLLLKEKYSLLSCSNIFCSNIFVLSIVP